MPESTSKINTIYLSTLSFLVGLALGASTIVGAYSSRLAVIETTMPKVNAIYDALLRIGVIKTNLSVTP